MSANETPTGPAEWPAPDFFERNRADYHEYGVASRADNGRLPGEVVNIPYYPWPAFVCGLGIPVFPADHPPRLRYDAALRSIGGRGFAVLLTAPDYSTVEEDDSAWSWLASVNIGDLRPLREMSQMIGYGLAVAQVLGYWCIPPHVAYGRGFPPPPYETPFWWHVGDIRPLTRPIHRPAQGMPVDMQVPLQPAAITALRLQGWR